MRYDPDTVTATPAQTAEGDQVITLESLVQVLRSNGLLETTFIEVLPGPDAPAQEVH